MHTENVQEPLSVGKTTRIKSNNSQCNGKSVVLVNSWLHVRDAHWEQRSERDLCATIDREQFEKACFLQGKSVPIYKRKHAEVLAQELLDAAHVSKTYFAQTNFLNKDLL